MPSRALAAFLLLTAALVAHAQQYRWTDEKGRIQYTDTPPPASAKGVQKKNLDSKPADSGAEPYALQVARKKSPVTLYTSPDCAVGCDDARKLLNQRGIPFNEVSISTTAQVEDLKRVSGASVVPVIKVGSAMQKGFDEASYHRALDIAEYPKPGALPPRSQAAPAAPAAPTGATAPNAAVAPAKAAAK